MEEEAATEAAAPEVGGRRFRSFRPRSRVLHSEATVRVVSAPPRVANTETEAVTAAATSTTSTTEVETEAADPVTEDTGVWSVSAPPTVNKGQLQEDREKDFEYESFGADADSIENKDSVEESDSEAAGAEDGDTEWVYYEGPTTHQRSLPLKVVVFAPRNGTMEHRMEHFYDGDNWPLLTLTLAIMLPVMLCVGKRETISIIIYLSMIQKIYMIEPENFVFSDWITVRVGVSEEKEQESENIFTLVK